MEMVYWDMESLRGRCKSNKANDPDDLPGSTTPRNMDKMNRPKYQVKREGMLPCSLLICCERKILFIGWKSTAYAIAESERDGTTNGKDCVRAKWRLWTVSFWNWRATSEQWMVITNSYSKQYSSRNDFAKLFLETKACYWVLTWAAISNRCTGAPHLVLSRTEPQPRLHMI